MSKLFEYIEVEIKGDFENADIDRINAAVNAAAEEISNGIFGAPSWHDMYLIMRIPHDHKGEYRTHYPVIFYRAAIKLDTPADREALFNSYIHLGTKDFGSERLIMNAKPNGSKHYFEDIQKLIDGN